MMIRTRDRGGRWRLPAAIVTRVGRLTGVVLAFALAVCARESARPAAASDESYRLVVDGSAELQRGQNDKALELFGRAAAADPKDPQPAFFAGTALNQMGRHDEALERLKQAETLGETDPELDFQAGRALVETRQWEAAVDRLARFEAARPGRGKTSEFLGRAYLGLGRYDEADAKFREALARDGSLSATVLPYQAALDQQRHEEPAAREKLERLQQVAPESATARAVRELALSQQAATGVLPAGVAGPAQGPDRFTLSLAAGYNSNARRVEATTVQAAVAGKGSVFEELTLAGSREFADGAGGVVAVGGQLLVDQYPQVEDEDVFDPSVYVEYRRPLGADVWASARLSDDYVLLGWDAFRNRLSARAAVDWTVADGVTVEGAYGWARDDYYFNTTRVLNPDSDTYTASVDFYVAPPGSPVRLRAGYFYSWTYAVGDDFDAHGGGALAGLSVDLPGKVTAAVSYAYVLEQYTNVNSLTADLNSPFQLPNYRRRDRIHAVGVRLSRPLDDRTTAYVGYDFNEDASNVPAYRYSENVVSVGVTWRF